MESASSEIEDHDKATRCLEGGMKSSNGDITNMNRIEWLLAGIFLASGTLSASAQWSHQVELYHWVDFPVEARGAADGFAKWDVEGSCSRVGPGAASVRSTADCLTATSKEANLGPTAPRSKR